MNQPRLEQPATAFIGRTQELAAITETLTGEGDRRARMLTITGPPGMGKSRLALVAAMRLAPAFPDGIVSVRQGATTQLAMLPGLLVAAIGDERPLRLDVLDALRTCLRSRKLLLLLDDLEPAILISSFIFDLLTAAPGLAVLATSPRASYTPGEKSFPLTALEATDATALFMARAARANPDRQPARADADALVEVCRLLGGAPLAIELIAPHTAHFTPAELAEQLRPTLIQAEGDPERVLEAVLSWAYARLSEAERILLGRLTIFARAFTRELVETVCADDPATPSEPAEWPGDRATIYRADVAGLLASLALKGFVFAARARRYRLLDAVRMFVLEQVSTVALPPIPSPAQPDALSPREREVADLLARGLSNREVAAALVVSERTVTTHITHILTKLDLTSRTQIAVWAINAGASRQGNK